MLHAAGPRNLRDSCGETASRAAASIGDAQIGEMMALFGISARALRLYEERGLVRPQRNRLNRRLYSEEDRRRLQLIVQLRAAGVNIADIARILDPEADRRQAESRSPVDLLHRRRAELLSQLAAVDVAISLAQTDFGRRPPADVRERIWRDR